jgi:[ribosomal protein S18]-alanine N-acetyltransferase
MTSADIPDVHDIERSSFPVPWPPYAFRQELESNRLAHYLVVRVDGEIVAYGGVWLMVDEAHVTTFAVRPEWRRRGIGGRLMLELLAFAKGVGASVATLEVRLTNVAARNLYQRFGFRPVGVRPRYYSDNGEDALIMTTESLGAPEMSRLLDQLRERYGQGLMPESEEPGSDDARARDADPGAAVPGAAVPEGASTAQERAQTAFWEMPGPEGRQQ